MQRIQHLVWLLFLWAVVIGLGLVGGFMEYTQKQAIIESQEAQSQFDRAPSPVAQPVFVINTDSSQTATFSAERATLPQITANSVWIYERNTDSLLLEIDSKTATSVASLAKLMTALVAVEQYPLDKEVTVGTASAAIGNRAKFLPEDVWSVQDLLQAMLIFSANDAAEALSHASGSSTEYIALMNERAQDLGMKSTQFANPSGLDHPDQYSSAEDLGTLTDAFLSVPTLAEIVRRPTSTLRERKTGRLDTVYTTNELLYQDPKYQGVKTGTTDLAGQSLIVRYKNDDFAEGPIDIIMVILGSEDRFADARALRTYLDRVLRLSLL